VTTNYDLRTNAASSLKRIAPDGISDGIEKIEPDETA
jgi:hypothetical protein